MNEVNLGKIIYFRLNQNKIESIFLLNSRNNPNLVNNVPECRNGRLLYDAYGRIIQNQSVNHTNTNTTKSDFIFYMTNPKFPEQQASQWSLKLCRDNSEFISNLRI